MNTQTASVGIDLKKFLVEKDELKGLKTRIASERTKYNGRVTHAGYPDPNSSLIVSILDHIERGEAD